ncbi:hypothetical protein [Gordonia sp. (in: high G+C Gram-positive bacteria)]|uniref:hypothetical protein n=1 Tax=Gordonia sp. (in: high G+C Gram-positive bacteria) TaxID=84139 RepID=UPI003F9C01E4
MKTWYAEHLRSIQTAVFVLTGAACGYLAVGWSHSMATNIGAAVALGLAVGLLLRITTYFVIGSDTPEAADDRGPDDEGETERTRREQDDASGEPQ